MKQIHWRTYILPLLAVGAGLMLFFGQAAVDGAGKALAMCGSTVIPSLFPFFVMSGLLTGLGAGQGIAQKLARPLRKYLGITPAGGMALLMGLLGGYPLGVRAVMDLYEQKRIYSSDVQKLLLFCNNTGPAFFVGAAGLALFGNAAVGLTLYVIHAVSAVLTGVWLQRLRPVSSPYTVQPLPEPKKKGVFPQAVVSACQSMLHISAFVVFFGAVLGVLRQLVPLSGLWEALVCGSLEMTSGVMALAGQSPLVMFCLAEVLITWGGVCVHCQAMALAGELMPVGQYLGAKLLQAVIAGAIALPVGLAELGCEGIPQNLRVYLWILPAGCAALLIVFGKILKKEASNSRQNSI